MSDRRELGMHGVQHAVVRTYEQFGCKVAFTAQSYRRGSRRATGTPGIPDLYVFPPYRAAVVKWPFWHEVKRPGGRVRPGQKEWQELCLVRGVAYVLGGVEEALAHLRAIGLLSGGPK